MVYKKLWKDFIETIDNKDLLEEALTHSSVVKEKKSAIDNERLEYLGDAVLKLSISRFLFTKYAKLKEGILTIYRSKLISDKTLSMLGKKLGLDKHVLVAGEFITAEIPDSIVGDALEALIGAIYLDAGFAKADEFILKLWKKDMQLLIKSSTETEYKSRLQHLIQTKYKILPEYQELSAEGPAHKRQFEMAVVLNSKIIGKAKAFSKKEATHLAAKEALDNKGEWYL